MEMKAMAFTLLEANPECEEVKKMTICQAEHIGPCIPLTRDTSAGASEARQAGYQLKGRH